jgi:hypothetical protein
MTRRIITKKEALKVRTNVECAAAAAKRNASGSPIAQWSGQLERRGVMTKVKTVLASLEENDDASRKAIERRAYTLYERDGFTDGHDHEHWFEAERELMIQDVPFSIDNDAVTVRLAIEDFPASTLVISISARSVLIFSLKDGTSNDCDDNNRECLRIISLPVEVDTAGVTCELDDRNLALRLPLVAGAPTFSKSACG